jgi:hypothetical protein
LDLVEAAGDPVAGAVQSLAVENENLCEVIHCSSITIYFEGPFGFFYLEELKST